MTLEWVDHKSIREGCSERVIDWGLGGCSALCGFVVAEAAGRMGIGWVGLLCASIFAEA